jgi:hypothetical protein
MMRVLCHVSHSAGHERTYQIDMPADGKGAKGGDVMTKTHAAGAAASYGMRYLLKMIFNLAVGEDDTDGNMPGDGKSLPETEVVSWLDIIEASQTLDDLKKYYSSAYQEAERVGDRSAIAAFVKAKDKRKRELAA